MSAHVLLNLLNLLRKGNKMLGKPHILSLFLNSFNKFNDTGKLILKKVSRQQKSSQNCQACIKITQGYGPSCKE